MNKLGLNAPQFPGMQTGKMQSVDEVRDLIKKQRRVKGYNITVPTGTTSFNLQLSGTARILLGIELGSFITGTDSYIRGFQRVTLCSFKVNNEIILDSVHPNFITNYGNDNEMMQLPRPLSGTDDITIEFTNPGATEVANIAIYYI
jgi:hypothetical protein